MFPIDNGACEEIALSARVLADKMAFGLLAMARMECRCK